MCKAPTYWPGRQGLGFRFWTAVKLPDDVPYVRGGLRNVFIRGGDRRSRDICFFGWRSLGGFYWYRQETHNIQINIMVPKDLFQTFAFFLFFKTLTFRLRRNTWGCTQWWRTWRWRTRRWRTRRCPLRRRRVAFPPPRGAAGGSSRASGHPWAAWRKRRGEMWGMTWQKEEEKKNAF